MKPITSQTSKVVIRKSDTRGTGNHGWLTAKHSFSFANYYDSNYTSYRSLRVINEDRIAPGKGFNTHPHSNMEIFTYVVSGQLEHKDSLGNGRLIEAGQFQYMSAGSGVLHSELNPSPDQETHMLQIWITPRQPGGTPLYADLDTRAIKRDNALTLLASANGEDQSIQIRQDACIYLGQLDTNRKLTLQTSSEQPYTWLQMIQGTLEIDHQIIHAGDAVHFEHTAPSIQSLDHAEFILFQLN